MIEPRAVACYSKVGFGISVAVIFLFARSFHSFP